MLFLLVSAAVAHDHDHTIHDDHRLLFGASGYGIGPTYQTSSLRDSDWSLGVQAGTLGAGAWARYTPYCSDGGFCMYGQFGPSARVVHTRQSQAAMDDVFWIGFLDVDDLATVYRFGELGVGSVVSAGVAFLRPTAKWGIDANMWTGLELNVNRLELVDDLSGGSLALVRRLGRPADPWSED